MKVGQGVSGWVAANKRTMANADSLLDLRDAIRSDGLLLNSCLSVPLTIGDVLLGVITLYSTEPNRFSPEERNLLESHISQFVNDLGSRAVTLDESSATEVKSDDKKKNPLKKIFGIFGGKKKPEPGKPDPGQPSPSPNPE